MLEKKTKEKEEMEAAKIQRKAERDAKRLQREREKEEKASRREQERAKEKGAGNGRGRGSGRGRGRGTWRGKVRASGDNGHLSPGPEKIASSSSNSGDDLSGNSDDFNSEQPCNPRCPVCNVAESEDEDDVLWIQCDNKRCATWYHVQCTNIDPQDSKDLDSITWLCPKCYF